MSVPILLNLVLLVVVLREGHALLHGGIAVLVAPAGIKDVVLVVLPDHAVPDDLTVEVLPPRCQKHLGHLLGRAVPPGIFPHENPALGELRVPVLVLFFPVEQSDEVDAHAPAAVVADRYSEATPLRVGLLPLVPRVPHLHAEVVIVFRRITADPVGELQQGDAGGHQ